MIQRWPPQVKKRPLENEGFLSFQMTGLGSLNIVPRNRKDTRKDSRRSLTEGKWLGFDGQPLQSEASFKGNFLPDISDQLPQSSSDHSRHAVPSSWSDVVVTCEPFRISGGLRKKKQQPNSVMGAGISSSSSRAKPRSQLLPGDTLPDDYAEEFPKGVKRRVGILLHPTSLPGSYGIGELGDDALHFLDWLKSAACTVWQVLPLVPPGRKSGEDGSPYSGQDANCGNTLLISLDDLVKWGLLMKTDLPKKLPVSRINFEAVAKVKDPLILKAAKKLLATKGGLREELDKFRRSPSISGWLEEAALFAAIDTELDKQYWWDWPDQYRDRDPQALESARLKHRQFIDEFIAQQFLFQRQWKALRKYANEKGIRIIGDMPIYVGGHSADVWAHRSLFMMNESLQFMDQAIQNMNFGNIIVFELDVKRCTDEKTGAPTHVSGVPPDDFSDTGQLWGSPLYNWKAMAADNYAWWVLRMKRAFALYDEFRIDHFRGLAGYWSVKAGEPSAMHGEWQMGPGIGFFNAVRKAVGRIEIIAEDLGVITPDVVELRKAIRAPGMAILQFGFGSDTQNPHLPHNHEVDQVVYPGTHDNDTVQGWWLNLTKEEREKVKECFRIDGDVETISWDFIDVALGSVARTAIIAMQDILRLDSTGRMNIPATQFGNWSWRMGESDVFSKLGKERARLHGLIKYYNRLPPELRDKSEPRKSRSQSRRLSLELEFRKPTWKLEAGLGTVSPPKSPKLQMP